MKKFSLFFPFVASVLILPIDIDRYPFRFSSIMPSVMPTASPSPSQQLSSREISRSDSSPFIVIPAFNEAKVIASVIADIRAAGYANILVVDDGSTDNTADEARKAGVEVLQHLINRGQGAALRTGIGYLSEEYDPDIIITFDSDGQHHAEDISKFIQAMQKNKKDIVLGSRFLDRTNLCQGIPFHRCLLLRTAILFTNIVSHIHLTDTHNGFRAFSRKAYKSIQISHRGMEHASDIIDEIMKHKLSYMEVPVQITYTDYSLGKGQKSSGFLKMGIKILLHKIFN